MKLTQDDRAEWLELQLKLLVDKLEGLIHERSRQRGALLGEAGSDKWSGSKRGKFESEFGREQAALTELKSAALLLRGSVTRQAAEAEKNDN